MRTRTVNSFMPGIERVQSGTESKTCPSDSLEIDFLIAKNKITSRHNISPIEVKSSTEFTDE